MDEKLQSILDEMGITLTNDQLKAFNSIVHNKRHTFCCGRPGVGKSLLIDVLKRYLGDKLLVGSTTGISNQRLFDGKGGEGSMHKIFSLSTQIFNDYNLKRVTNFTSDVLGKNYDLEYVLIDEAGFLLNADSLELIKLRLERFNRKYKDRPRRELKLILFGDLAQLPAFFKKDEEDYMRSVYGNPFFFKSRPFFEMDFNIVGINQVMRTDNKVFKASLDVLRYGQSDRYIGVCKWLNSVMYKPTIPDGLPVMVTNNAEAERINMEKLDENPNKLWVYKSKLRDNYNIKNCPSGESVCLKVGALVMTLINDTEYGEFNNGSIGEVTMATKDNVYIKMFHSNKEVSVGWHTFEDHELFENGEKTIDGVTKPILESRVIGECDAIPLALAYCLNVHKSQGSTIDSPCVVDLGRFGFNPRGSFGDAIVYVALSRFSNPEHVYLKYPLTPRHLRVNQEIIDWLKEYVGEEYSY